MTLLKEGRPSGHELNTTGVDMPPKGGNPSLSDDDLVTIIAYLRSINQ
jgi:disulfide bond formation protein DsbB